MGDVSVAPRDIVYTIINSVAGLSPRLNINYEVFASPLYFSGMFYVLQANNSTRSTSGIYSVTR